MKSNASLRYNAFLVVGDFLALVVAFIGAFVLRVTLDSRPIAASVSATTYLRVFLVLLPFWILIFTLLGLYENRIYEKRFIEIGRLFVGSFIGLLFVIFWNFLSVKPIFPAKLVPIYGFVLAFILLVVFRNLARLLRTLSFRFGHGITNVLIIGNTAVTTELADSLYNSSRSGYKVVGMVGKQSTEHKDIKVFSSFDEACSKIGIHNIHSIVQTELYASSEKNNAILEFAQVNHIAYRFIPGNTELFVGNIEVELFRSSVPVIAIHQTPLLGWGRIIKRVFDIAVAILLIILTSPIIVVVSIANYFASGGVFFRQTRLTRFNQKFRVFKFRSQYKKYDGTTPEEAFEQIGKPELAKAYRENGDFLMEDPRITPFGKFLRRTSLDELPQLFNVLRGDLSLVGPRALIPQELSAYEKRHAILSVKSGITGLAQVSGRKNINFEERRQLDIYYVQNWSFWMDVVILVKTLRVILQGS